MSRSGAVRLRGFASLGLVLERAAFSWGSLRAPGIIPVEATQRPSADIIPTSLRDLFGYRWAFRCSTEASSDTILGHGWANMGYSATEIDPKARGVGWLRAEDGTPVASRPPTSPMPTSSTWPPGRPRPAPTATSRTGMVSRVGP